MSSRDDDFTKKVIDIINFVKRFQNFIDGYFNLMLKYDRVMSFVMLLNIMSD